MNNQTASVDVVVVGAGVSGLLAARDLSAASLSAWAQLDYVWVGFRLDRLVRQLDPTASWTHRRAAEWGAMTFGDWLTGRVRTRQVHRAMRIVTLTSFGREPEELSFFGVLHHIATAGGLEALTEGALGLRVKGGTARIASRLHAGLGDSVLTGTTVLQIFHDELGARVRTSEGDLDARAVIVAMARPRPTRSASARVSPSRGRCCRSSGAKA